MIVVELKVDPTSDAFSAYKKDSDIAKSFNKFHLANSKAAKPAA